MQSFETESRWCFSLIVEDENKKRHQLKKNLLEKKKGKEIISNQYPFPFAELHPMWIDFLLYKE